MANFEVQYQVLKPGMKKPSSGGVNYTVISANSASEAKQKFLAGHRNSSSTTYKITSVVKR
jgi:hypothetical protein